MKLTPRDAVQNDNSLYLNTAKLYIEWTPGDKLVSLFGGFTPDDLLFIAQHVDANSHKPFAGRVTSARGKP